MERSSLPKPGEIYKHFKDKLYQVITVATHSETREAMVVYQALYGDFKTYVRPLDMFMSEVDQEKYPEVKQRYRFELWKAQEVETIKITEDRNTGLKVHSEDNSAHIQKKELTPEDTTVKEIRPISHDDIEGKSSEEAVNSLLLRFLDAESYNKKLEILTSNIKHLDDRLVNDMAVALDCTVDEGPLDQRIQALIYCLQAMCRFEDRRLR